MPSPDLGLAAKDTSTSCIFAFPDRPIDSLPPNYPPGPPPDLYPYNPDDDWPTIPHDPPVPGVDPIPGSNPHPVDTIPPGGDLFVAFQTYTSRDSSGSERRDLYLAILPSSFPARFDLGWNISGQELGLVQAANEYTPRDTMDSILQAETGHSTFDPNTFCGLAHYSKLFASGQLINYFFYYAFWWNPLVGNGSQLWSFSPLAIAGGIDNPPHLLFDNAAPLLFSPPNFHFWALHSNLGLPEGTTLVTKTLNTAKITTDETVPYTVDIG